MSNETMRAEFEALYSVPPMTQWSEKHGEYKAALESIRDDARTYTSMFFAYCIGRQKAARAQSAEPNGDYWEGYEEGIKAAREQVPWEWVTALSQCLAARAVEAGQCDGIMEEHGSLYDRCQRMVEAEERKRAPQPRPDWFLYGERLPDEDDEDCEGNVWNYMPGRSSTPMLTTAGETRRRYETGIVVHWKPTGLECPIPPEG